MEALYISYSCRSSEKQQFCAEVFCALLFTLCRTGAARLLVVSRILENMVRPVTELSKQMEDTVKYSSIFIGGREKSRCSEDRTLPDLYAA